jgi:predicted transcriptional regulator
MYISSIDEEIRIADLAKALNEDRSIILRIVIELESRDMITSRKEGRYVFVKKRKELVSPFVLDPIQ